MKIAFQNVLWWFLFWSYNYLCLAKDSVTIGAFFNEENSQTQIPLKSTVYAKNLIDQKVYYKTDIRIISKTDSFAASKSLCNLTESDNGVAVVIGPESTTTSALIESFCTNFEIPHLQTTWRHSTVQDSVTVLNFYPEAELFAQGLAAVVKNLQWKTFVVIYENEEGLIRLQEVLKLQEYDPDNKQNTIIVKQLSQGLDHRTLLKEIKNTTESRIILDCEADHIINILEQAKEVELLELFYSYFLTSLDAHTIDFSSLNTSANITTIRLFDPKSDDFINAVKNWELTEYHHGNKISLTPNIIKAETALMHDAVLLFIDSLNSLKVTVDIETTPISCTNSSDKWPGGFTIVSYMKVKQPMISLTGPIKFDENGRRINFELCLIDVIQDKQMATWSPETGMVFSRTDNENVQAVVENLQRTTVIVSSRIGEPFLRYRKPRYEGEVLTGNARYEGYSMDLIAGIAEILNFTFQFHLAADGKYGNYDPKTKQWNGLIKDLLDRRAHLAICDLTITHQRREVVDFSMPFMTLGISILYKKAQEKDVNMFAFLEPFSISVWIYTATLYLAVTLILYFVSRMAPGDWENPHPCDENPEELENIWDIKNCLWLTLGSIMTQGCDILPKGISSRMAASMWWFFSLIMTSSYTANLAAFLTMERMEPTIDSAEALAKQTKIKYGALEGGATQAFFRDSNYSTYERMWINMQSSKPTVFEKNNKDGVNRVQTTRNALYAFLMESSQIEYEIETKCDLKQVGQWLDSKGFGIAMPVNAPYRSAINKAVLRMQEDGKLNELKTKWWKKMRNEPSCNDGAGTSEVNSAELALANVGGVFLVLGIGVGIAFVLAICEFLWNVRNVSVEEHLSYMEALKVELKFACNVWVTKKRTKPEIEESSSSSSSNSRGGDAKSLAHSILHGAGSFLNVNVVNKIGSTLHLNE